MFFCKLQRRKIKIKTEIKTADQKVNNGRKGHRASMWYVFEVVGELGMECLVLDEEVEIGHQPVVQIGLDPLQLFISSHEAHSLGKSFFLFESHFA